MTVMRTKPTEIHSERIKDIWLSHLQLARLYSVYIAFQSKIRMWYNRKRAEMQMKPEKVNDVALCNGTLINFHPTEVYIRPRKEHIKYFYKPIFDNISRMHVVSDWTTISVPFDLLNNKDVKTIEEFLDVLERSSMWIWLPYPYSVSSYPIWDGFYPLARDSNTKLFKEIDFYSGIGELRPKTFITNKNVQHLIDIYTELLENLTLNIL